MNTLTRWDPFRELEDMRHRLTGVLGHRNGNESGLSEWAPLVDITEDDKEYLIKADLPDIKKEEIKVRVENGTLILSGERKFEKEEKNKKYHRVERSYGSFMRSFGLPEDADADKVNAEFKDGVLKVHLAKSEAARPKQVEVKIS